MVRVRVRADLGRRCGIQILVAEGADQCGDGGGRRLVIEGNDKIVAVCAAANGADGDTCRLHIRPVQGDRPGLFDDAQPVFGCDVVRCDRQAQFTPVEIRGIGVGDNRVEGGVQADKPAVFGIVDCAGKARDDGRVGRGLDGEGGCRGRLVAVRPAIRAAIIDCEGEAAFAEAGGSFVGEGRAGASRRALASHPY